MEPKEGYVTLKELSKKLKIKANTLYCWAVRDNKLKWYKEKNRIYVQDVERASLFHEKVCPNCNARFLCFRATKKYDKKICGSQYRARNWARRHRQRLKEERNDI